MPDQPLRLSEIMGGLSLATDLGIGRPMGHGLRSCLLAVDAGTAMGLDDEAIRTVHHVALLRFLGCTADSAEMAESFGGNDQEANASFAPAINGTTFEMMRAGWHAVDAGLPAVRRATLFGRAMADASATAKSLAAHCEVATMLAGRLGLGDEVTRALDNAYERWDGRGYPRGRQGEAIPIAARIATVAGDIDLFVQSGADARAILQKRRGRAYDPGVVDAFDEFGNWSTEADWDRIMDSEPSPVAVVEDLDSALGVMADFIDLKSSWTRGHSTKVADLAEGGAREASLAEESAVDLRRAGLIHDLGRIGVENGIWDKEGSLSIDEEEKVRLHPYLTQRILARCSGLARLGELASSHHERLDGSGYHRQSTSEQLSFESSLLAAADVLAALTSERPHRARRDLKEATEIMRREVDLGLLDQRAVECVVAAAGGESRFARADPTGLTDREIEVLRLVSTGLTNRETAERLFISPKTVGRHVENIYTKIGVSSRAAAAVYAMEHRLLD
ncbi:MAG TPA: HD domain-containing phosphohydrolase [Acidimicrobiia bacterium]|nr:HD domain-containing phosphohydrolase [Acidimicrobiia bacterium]